MDVIMNELVLGEFSWAYDPTADYKWTRHTIGQQRGPKSGLVFSQPHVAGRSLTPNELRTVANFIEQYNMAIVA